MPRGKELSQQASPGQGAALPRLSRQRRCSDRVPRFAEVLCHRRWRLDRSRSSGPQPSLPASAGGKALPPLQVEREAGHSPARRASPGAGGDEAPRSGGGAGEKRSARAGLCLPSSLSINTSSVGSQLAVLSALTEEPPAGGGSFGAALESALARLLCGPAGDTGGTSPRRGSSPQSSPAACASPAEGLRLQARSTPSLPGKFPRGCRRARAGGRARTTFPAPGLPGTATACWCEADRAAASSDRRGAAVSSGRWPCMDLAVQALREADETRSLFGCGRPVAAGRTRRPLGASDPAPCSRFGRARRLSGDRGRLREGGERPATEAVAPPSELPASLGASPAPRPSGPLRAGLGRREWLPPGRPRLLAEAGGPSGSAPLRPRQGFSSRGSSPAAGRNPSGVIGAAAFPRARSSSRRPSPLQQTVAPNAGTVGLKLPGSPKFRFALRTGMKCSRSRRRRKKYFALLLLVVSVQPAKTRQD